MKTRILTFLFAVMAGTSYLSAETVFSESFSSSQGNFTIDNKSMDSNLSYVWKWKSSDYGIVASGFKNNTNYAAESWLISPSISLAGYTSANLSFNQAVNKGAPTNLSVKVSSDNGYSWSDLSISQWPAGTNWNFITSTVSLAAYNGQTIKIAFCYISTSSLSPQWEIKNFVVTAEPNAKDVFTCSSNFDKTQGSVYVSGEGGKGINDISFFTQEGISQSGYNNQISIPIRYLAYKANSCSTDQFCEITIKSPSGLTIILAGASSNGNYFLRSTSWVYNNYKKIDGYYFFNLQAIEEGVWTLTDVQKNAGQWYYCYIASQGIYEYLSEVSLEATPNYGYHFVQWSDGNTDNPRTIVLTQDTTFTAEFALDRSGTCGNDYLLTWDYDTISKTLTISGDGAFVQNIQCGVEARPILEKVIIGEGVTAIKSDAFADCPHLTSVEWNAVNGGDYTACPFPATVTSVTFGENVAHIPAYLCIGMNTMNSLVFPASLNSIGEYAFKGWTEIKQINIPNEVETIGAHAFDSCIFVTSIYLGNAVAEIGDYAFKGCIRVNDITSMNTTTPVVYENTLTSISPYAYLFVQAGSKRTYQLDPYWSRFDIREIASEETTVTQDAVTVEANEDNAVFTWPVDNNAASYSLQITKDSVVFCVLTFNANGQLIGIAFAPGRNGQKHAPAATTSLAGMSFTVTGLNGASKYAYRLAATDEQNNELVAYNGEFATTGYEGEVDTGGEPERPEGIEITSDQSPITNKVIVNGQIFILRGDKTYTITGQQVK